MCAAVGAAGAGLGLIASSWWWLASAAFMVSAVWLAVLIRRRSPVSSLPRQRPVDPYGPLAVRLTIAGRVTVTPNGSDGSTASGRLRWGMLVVMGQSPSRFEYRRVGDEVVIEHGREPQVSLGDLVCQLALGSRVGATPKTAARLLRYTRAAGLLARSDLRPAQVAALCGYADQSHLTREYARFAGTTPGAATTVTGSTV